MDVLMVTSSYPKFPGDVTAPFIESIARGVAARGHRVDVVLPHHPALRRGADEPVPFHTYRYAPREDWSVWGYAQSLHADVKVRKAAWALAPVAALALRSAVARLLQERRYDVLHAHWVVPNAAVVAGLSRTFGVPLVVSLHGSDVFVAERHPAVGALAAAAFRQAGAVPACSEDLAARAKGLGAPPERVHTVPYGVDLQAFAPPAEPGPRAHGPLRVLALGRLVEKKGFATLVESVAGGRGVEVCIAGDGDLRDELTRMAAERRAPVRLVGPLDRDAVAEAFAEADVVAVPSLVDRAGNVDGLPNVLLEAMAAGKPVVASRVAGIPDVVTDAVDGILVPPGDPAALAEALGRLGSDEGLRDRLGAAARRTAVSRLGWDVAAARIEECYVQAAALAAR
jgi:glycosyltransferase involved in cell wall biosynthesis